MGCNNCFNGCAETTSDQCIKYTGLAIPALGINNGDTLSSVELAITTYLVNAIDGSGIYPDIDQTIICNVISKYLAACAGCDGLSLNELLTAIIKGVCDLQIQIDDTNAVIAELEGPYNVNCLDGVVSDSGTHDILQATIDKLCDLNLVSLLENIGTGENVYKGYDPLTKKHQFKAIKDSISLDASSDATDVSLEIKENLQTIGGTAPDAYSVYKDFDATTKKHKIRSLSTSSLKLGYNLANDEVTIDLIPDLNNPSFYVNQYSSASSEEGTEVKPFKTLNKAITAFIGTGSWMTPQFAGYKITLLSSVTLHATPGSNYVGMLNLDVNRLDIVGNGHYLELNANPTPGYYPISTNRMSLAMDKNPDGTLKYSIYLSFNNVFLQRIGTSAIVDHLNFSNPVVTHTGPNAPQQETTSIEFTDVTFTNDTTRTITPDWSTVPDPQNGNAPLTFFGTTIYVSKTVGIDVPMVKTAQMAWNKEGYLKFNGTNRFYNSLGTYLHCTNTTISTNELAFARNQTRILYNDKIAGIYTPKSGQFYIELNDVRYSSLKASGPQTIPKVVVSSTPGAASYHVGGSDAWLKASASSSNIVGAKIEGGYNNVIQSEGICSIGFTNVEIIDTSLNDVHKFYKILSPTPSTPLNFSALNSQITNVVVSPTDLSYIREVTGYGNTLNYYSHNNTGVLPFANNAAAIAAGLFKGIEYITSTGEARKVV